jgi:hypothetical protein
MIVCSCNIVTRKDIEQVVVDFLNEDEWQLITPERCSRLSAPVANAAVAFPV